MEEESEIAGKFDEEQRLFLAFTLLRSYLASVKGKAVRVQSTDLAFMFDCYCLLLSNRKSVKELEERMKIMNKFMGIA